MTAELPLLRSDRLPPGFVHGFTTRAGGISEGPFGALNLGAKWGDDPARVRENRRRLFRAAGVERLYSATQVHGSEVVALAPQADPEEIAGRHADALCAAAPGLALAIYSADCIALLFCDPKTGAIAAAHAGWRGTAAGIARATVSALGRAFGARPEDLHVALGPSIGPCCFEVGPEVAEKFAPAFVRSGAGRSGRATVDLRAANRAALIEAGVPETHIDADPPCTGCEPARFFSYRRDGRQTGQHVGFIVRRP